MNLGIVAEFHFQNVANLSEFMNFYSPWNYQETIDFLIILGK